MNRYVSLAALAALVFTTTVYAADPTDKCEAVKLKLASKYGACRLKAEAKAVLKGDAPDTYKCESKWFDKWTTVEFKADPGVCASEGDHVSVDRLITRHSDDVVTLLSGGSVRDCGDNVAESTEQCDGTDLAGASCVTLGFNSGVLACDAGCGFDTSGCACAAGQLFPATGQTTAYGAGSDGDVQAGAPLAYTDNGDGTITDNNTGLMWEKKDDSGGIHDKDNTYSWSTGSPYNMNGTISTVFLATMNGGGGFAGYTDWRIPNYKELTSILDLQVLNPAVDPTFHKSATCTGCTDVTLASCSCTVSESYWSSTAGANATHLAYIVDFGFCYVGQQGKTNLYYVRAIRGGL